MRLSLLAVAICGLAACTPSEEDDSGDDTSDPTEVPDATSYAEALMASSWGDNVTLTVDGDSLVITSNGLPDHEVLEAYGLMDGTTTAVTTYDMSVTVPLTPVYQDATTATGMGTIGGIISGAVIFNPYEGDGTSVAVDNNFDVDGVPFLDSCNGHPLPSGDNYHYHGVPYCITDTLDTAGEHSKLLGVLLDGFPVYGAQGSDGTEPTDLDECSGHAGVTPEFPDGIYHYHLTESAPYSIDCYHGEAADSGDGGPPDGGPPGGPPP